MEKHIILYTADTHGNEIQYKKLVDLAIEKSVNSIIIGGDLTPKTPIEIERQKEFIIKKLSNLLLPLKEKLPKAKLFLMLSNDDCSTNLSLLKKNDPLIYKLIQNKRLPLSKDFEIVGYPYVPITPFKLKDWEKFDLSLVNSSTKREYELRKKGVTFNGFKTKKGEWIKFYFNQKLANEDSIQKDLTGKMFTSNPLKTVYVFHSPPNNTNLDQIRGGHVGSFAIREFIEQRQPYLTLHGHIHETVDVSGKYFDKIGDTICLSPGNDDRESTLSVLLFDLYNLSNIERLRI